MLNINKGVVFIKTVFLLSHTPIPRFIKRIEVSNKVSDTHLIFWDRVLNKDINFTLPRKIKVDPIVLKAPQGKAIKRSILLIIFSFKAIFKLIKSNPSVLHVGNFDMLLIAYIYKVIFNNKVEIIYEIGDLPEVIFKDNIISRIFMKIEKTLLKKTKKIILTSPYFWEVYYKKIIDEEKYLLIPNVPNISLLDQEENYVMKKNKKIVIGFIGAIRYKKQLKMLIDCLKTNNEFQIMIAGTGPDYKEIKDYAINNQQVVFTGAYNYTNIKSLYNSVDIVYSVYDVRKTNVKYALPNRLYESIIFKKPIIVANDTELGKFVISKGIGYTTSHNDDSQLAYLINYLVKNEESIKLKKFNASKLLGKYTYEAYIPKIMKLYK